MLACESEDIKEAQLAFIEKRKPASPAIVDACV
jgi:hypothetical protein